jgi:hypothetical protein
MKYKCIKTFRMNKVFGRKIAFKKGKIYNFKYFSDSKEYLSYDDELNSDHYMTHLRNFKKVINKKRKLIKNG